MKKSVIIMVAAIAVLLLLGGCASNTEEENMESETGKTFATVETEKGVIKFELYTGDAPVTTKNFIDLAESEFYDGLIFHRVVRGFVIQGGDPLGTGTGGSGKNIPLEISPKLRHTDGAVAMARSSHPDSASSQFYITEGEQSFLDDNYAVFGQVTEGFDVVRKIEVGDKMLKVTITRT